VLFKGDAPGKTEDEDGIPFNPRGKSGALLRDVLHQTNGGLEGCGFDNGVKCRPIDKQGMDRAPTAEEQTACAHYFRENLKKYHPKVVVLLGNTAVQEHFPQADGITRIRGQVKHQAGVTYLFAYHPSYVQRQGGLATDAGREFVKDIRKAIQLSGRAAASESFKDIREGKSVLVETVAGVRKIVKQILTLPRGSVVACDTEDRNLHRVYDNDMVSIQFSWDGETAYVIPLKHPQTPFFTDDFPKISALLRKVFTAATVKLGGKTRKVNRWIWLMHKAVFDLHQIHRELGVDVTNNPVVDSMQVAYLLDENRIAGSRDPKEYYYPDRERGLSLSLLTRMYLGDEYAYDGDDKADRWNVVNWTLDRLRKYGGKDAWGLWRLFQELLIEAEGQGYREKLLRLVYFLYSDAYLGIVAMEQNGFLADIDELRRLLDPKRSVLLKSMYGLVDKLKKSRPAQVVNKRIWKQESSNIHSLWGGVPWVMSLTKDAHLRMLFFDEMGLEPVSFTEKGKLPQVNASFYEVYGEWDEDGNPLNEAAIVKDWNGLHVLVSTFVNAIYKWVHPDTGDPDMRTDGRVRGTFGLTSTVTARLAHSNPNMANFPRANTPPKKAAKNILISPRDRVLVGADLMANEVRMGANESEDKVLGKLFYQGRAARDAYRKVVNHLDPKTHTLYREYLTLEKKAKWCDRGKKKKSVPLNSEAIRIQEIALEGGEALKHVLFLRVEASLKGDIHRMTASEFFGVDIHDVTKNLRTETKTIVFGYMYGRGIKSIASQIKKDVAATKRLCNAFDSKYVRFARRLQTWPDDARKNGYVESILGRRRRFNPAIWENAPEWVQSHAEKQAKNSPIQGVASDACLIAIGILQRYILRNKLQGRWKLVNTVHDAIYMEVPFEDVPRAVRVMELCLSKWAMRHMVKHFGVKFVAPMECDFGIGIRWGDLHEWDFSIPMLEVILMRVALEHKEKWGKYPKGAMRYIRYLRKQQHSGRKSDG